LRLGTAHLFSKHKDPLEGEDC